MKDNGKLQNRQDIFQKMKKVGVDDTERLS